jgi:hypothetical protein
MVTRHALLLASLAALIGLQVPLCEFACGIDPASLSAAASTPEAAPCHEPTEREAPAPGPSHDACGCASVYAAPVAGTEVPEAPPGWALLGARSLRIASGLPGDRVAQHRHLTCIPPPDILLLKSTLIL